MPHLLRLQLRAARLPFALPVGISDLLWPATSDDDPPCRFVRDPICEIARAVSRRARLRGRSSSVTIGA